MRNKVTTLDQDLTRGHRGITDNNLGALVLLCGYKRRSVLNSKDAKDAKALGENLESRIQNPEGRMQNAEDGIWNPEYFYRLLVNDR